MQGLQQVEVFVGVDIVAYDSWWTGQVGSELEGEGVALSEYCYYLGTCPQDCQFFPKLVQSGPYR